MQSILSAGGGEHMDGIVTRNLKDYLGAGLPVTKEVEFIHRKGNIDSHQPLAFIETLNFASKVDNEKRSSCISCSLVTLYSNGNRNANSVSDENV